MALDKDEEQNDSATLLRGLGDAILRLQGLVQTFEKKKDDLVDEKPKPKDRYDKIAAISGLISSVFVLVLTWYVSTHIDASEKDRAAQAAELQVSANLLAFLRASGDTQKSGEKTSKRQTRALPQNLDRSQR